MKEENEKAYRLFEALSGVDADLLERSEKSEGKKVIPFSRFVYVAAACICLLAVGATILLQPKQRANESTAEHASLADFAMLEKNAVAEDGMAENNAVRHESIAIEAPSADAVFDFADEAEEDTTEGIALEESGKTSDKIMPKEELVSVSKDRLNGRSIETLEQVQEELAPYLLLVPSGYGFEGAYESDGVTTVVWSMGMQDIWWSVEKVNPEDINCVDVSATERYDVHRYEIPYAETVPVELWEDFRNPIFAAGDLDITVLERRIKAAQDAGDEGKLRGDFSILFPDGTLARYNGCGSAKQVWSMLEPMLSK